MVAQIQAAPRYPTRHLLLPLLLLATPGAGSMWFDGLPFTGQLETLSLLTLAFLALGRRASATLALVAPSPKRMSALRLIVIVLVTLKLLTFFRFPLGDNFEVCIKSIYSPRETACERSFDYLFHSNDGVNGLGAISRVDDVVDFRTTSRDELSTLGASHSTWKLPFQNEYPRFDQLWLNRLPFTARIGGVINPIRDGFIPIEFTGSLSIRTQLGEYSFESYERRKLAFVQVSKGRQEIVVDYRYSDDETEAMPDAAPVPRGPYAHLVFGSTIGPSETSNFQFNVRGHVINERDLRLVKSVAVRGRLNELNLTREMGPDVGLHFGNERYSDSGFVTSTDATGPVFSRYTHQLIATLSDGSRQTLGTLAPPAPSSGLAEYTFVRSANSTLTSDFKAWLTLGKDPNLLTAEHRIPPSLASQTVMVILDLAHIALFLVAAPMLLLLRLRHRKNPMMRLLVAGGAILALDVAFSRLRLESLSILPLNWIVLTPTVVLLAVWLTRARDALLLPFSIIVGFIVGVPRILSAYRLWGGLEDAAWWGFMVFRDRPMDWFVFQGYAYQILTQQSLRAGESLFYFVPGARYFVFASHIIFGNNDVLIGMLVASIFVASAVWFGSKALELIYRERLSVVTVGSAMFALVWVASGSLSIQLASGSASEILAWTLCFYVGAQILTRPTTGLMAGRIGSALGIVVFLRPNFLFVSLLFAIGATLQLWERAFVRERAESLLLSGWLWLGFLTGASLSLMHNMYYAESLTPFLHSAAGETSVFPPQDLLEILWNRDVQSAVLQRFRTYGYWTEPRLDVEQVGSWLSQATYLLAVARLVRVRDSWLPSSVYLAAPIAYVVTTSPFAITTIAERQTNMLTFAFAISATISSVTGLRKRGVSEIVIAR